MKLFNMKSNRVSGKANGVNGKKKKSKVNKLIPPVAMISASMLLMAYSSYAWFAMNTQTTAEGMKVRVKSEGGIVISDIEKQSWGALATAKATNASLLPTSTFNLNDWYHNKSTDINKSDASFEYEKLNDIKLTASNYGIGYIDSNTSTNGYDDKDDQYYLLNKFYIKSSGEELNTPLYINEVTVTKDVGKTFNDIENSLRIAITVTNQTNTFIFAPLSNGTTPATFKYKVKNDSASQVECYKSAEPSSDEFIKGFDLDTGINSIPASGNTPIEVNVYCYFEGEDANCKSINPISADYLNVTVKLGTAKTHESTP